MEETLATQRNGIEINKGRVRGNGLFNEGDTRFGVCEGSFGRNGKGKEMKKFKIVELKKGMVVKLPYKVFSVVNNYDFDIIGLNDNGDIVFINSDSYYVAGKNGWVKPFKKEE